MTSMLLSRTTPLRQKVFCQKMAFLEGKFLIRGRNQNIYVWIYNVK